MTNQEQLIEKLGQLPPEQAEGLAAQVLQEWESLLWDMRIEADAKAGKLDKMIEEAKAEHRAGLTTPRLP